jgi:hypothetical protein
MYLSSKYLLTHFLRDVAINPKLCIVSSLGRQVTPLNSAVERQKSTVVMFKTNCLFAERKQALRM